MVRFVLDSFANRIYWNFPFFRQVPLHPLIQTKGQKAGPHMGPSLLSGSTSAKSLQTDLKISRKATEIIEKSTENQLKPKKPMDFKGKVQNKLKSRQKVCKICQKILHLGGGHDSAIIFSDRFCTLSVYVLTCFELSL